MTASETTGVRESSGFETVLFTFVEDFLDEGEEFLENIQVAGVDRLAAAFTYHSARDIVPHAGARRIRFMESGATRFQPNRALYPTQGGLPFAAAALAGGDPLDPMRDGLQKVGVELEAWLVLCHSTGVGRRYPDLTVETAFGDRLLTTLCPSNPTVQAYFASLVTDLINRGISTIYCESIDFPPIEHGYHHERWLVPLGELPRFLLSVCFCDACISGAQATGVDAEAVRRRVTDFVELALQGEDPHLAVPLTPETLSAATGDETMAYLTARERRVADCVGSLSDVANSFGARLEYLDLTGARVTASDQSESLIELAWRYGIDPALIGERVSGYMPLCYRMDTDRMGHELSRYRSALKSTGSHSSVAIRPGFPDTSSEGQLIDRLRLIQDAGCERVAFYAYGLMRMNELRRLGAVLNG